MITTLIGTTLQLNDQNALVVRLHRILDVLGHPVINPDTSAFIAATEQAVKDFQTANGLSSTGVADAATSSLLESRYVQDGSGAPHNISGVIADIQTGTPVAHVRVEIWDDDTSDVMLGEAYTDAAGQYTISFDEMAYSSRWPLAPVLPDVYFKLFQAADLVQTTEAAPEQALAKGDHSFNFKVDELPRVNGYIYSEKRIGVPGLTVTALDKNVGQEVVLGTAQTDENGYYIIHYTTAVLTVDKPLLDIQIRVADDIGTPLADSPIRYDAASQESIDLILPADSIPEDNEYQRIIGDLQALLGTMPLSGLQEDETQGDITYLANKTGWDARLIAMVSLAETYSNNSGIPAPYYYALFRAGLPTDEKGINELDTDTVTNVWNEAIAENIIDSSYTATINANVQLYDQRRITNLLQQDPPVGVSTLDSMLDLSLNSTEKDTFVGIYYNAKDDTTQLWNDVEQEFGAATKDRLQTDGKLGLLTINNAPLIDRLRVQTLIQDDPVELVAQGLYNATAWDAVLAQDIDIPEDIPGADATEKRQNYMDYMASQLKIGYPTAVLAEQVDNDDFALSDAANKTNVTDFLRQHQADFNVSKTPVEKYIADNAIGVDDAVKNELTRLQRTYQISPSDAAMQVLLNEGLDSAYAVVKFGAQEFMDNYGDTLGNDAAKLIYAKSQQIHSMVINIATGYMAHKVNPSFHVLKGEANTPSDIIAYPTLDELFGEMDFCECSHCRSVLSPAAYLADLLSFIDKSPSNQDALDGKENPLDVLLERRPDIQHIQLSCENTNIVLPYIDLVNEILEHFVVHADQQGVGISDPLFNPLEGFEGYDMDGSVTTEELLANPQFVKSEAYGILKQQLYPFQLPFNQYLAALRLLFEQLEVPLYQAMTILRPDDQAATWQDIYTEYLGLSKEAYAILTDNASTIAEYYGEAMGADLNAVLTSSSTYAKDFSRKTGISYKELTEIVTTQFMNPASRFIPKLEQTDVNINDIVAFIDGGINGASFDALLPANFDETPYGGDVKAWILARGNDIKGLILLVDKVGSGDDCSFAQLELRHADDTVLSELEYFKLMRFIRLWKALGWTIAQTDKIITALWPDAANANTTGLLNQGFATLITRIAHLKKVMEHLKLNPDRDLLQALALFADIDTQGRQSLYKNLFLNATITKIDTVFLADENEDYLVDVNPMVLDHEEAVLAAFNLTSEALNRILTVIAEANALAGPEDVPLSLTMVSAIYRHAFLSRTLRLSIQEFFIVKDITQTDPFAPLTDVDPAIVTFIAQVQRLQEAKVKISDLTYYLRHEDLSGTASPEDEAILAVAKRLKDELQRVTQEYSVIDDPTGEATRTQMALRYEQEAVDGFFNIINNKILFIEEDYDHHLAELESELTTASSKISYNDFQKTLSFEGIMTTAEKQALDTAAVIIADANDRTDFTTAVQALYDQGQHVTLEFFTKYPELDTLYNDYLIDYDFNQLLEAMLATFKDDAKQRVVRQTLADLLDLDLEWTAALLDHQTVLHAVSDVNSAAIHDYLPLAQNGVSATYIFQDESEETQMLEDLNTDQHPMPNGQPIGRASYSFVIETSGKGFYNLQLETDPGATVLFRFPMDDIEISGSITNGVWTNTDPVELEANSYYVVEIDLENISAKAILTWAPENGSGGYQRIPLEQLYPITLLQAFGGSYLKLVKAVALIEMLGLTPAETLYFGEAYQIDGQGFLNAIPLSFDREDNTTHEALWDVVDRLLHYQQIKEALAVANDDLITVLKDPEATYKDAEDNEKELLFKITGWDKTAADSLITAFGMTYPDLSDIKNMHKVWEAHQLIQTVAIPADGLINATTNDPDESHVIRLEQAIRIKYDADAWLKVIQPVNDKLRNQQRDALVAHVLQLMQQNDKTVEVDTKDKLFEYFLIDVEMDACMKTSRIKQALSSVQLFINRCFINLEPLVASTYINNKQWAWMSRYRVWEANRKVFLYPENWLEPEWRDDKSTFFKELESELLQSDITDEAAHTALLNYLEKLDDVAKLEICGIYLDEKEVKKNGSYYGDDDVLHVFGRTAGANRKYYHRRYEYGYWTPWEKVDVDVEDNPILPVVWNGRLFLFWLTIITKGAENTENLIKKGNSDKLTDAEIDTGSMSTDIKVEANLSWSEYYNGKWQPRRTSDFEDPVKIGSYPSGDFNRKDMHLEAIEDDEGALYINVWSKAAMILYNKHSVPEKGLVPSVKLKPGVNRTINDTYDDGFHIDYYTVTHENQAAELAKDDSVHEILNRSNFNTVITWHEIESKITNAPFFIQNARHVFHVIPLEEQPTIPKYDKFGLFLVEKAIDTGKVKIDLLREKPQIVKDIPGEAGISYNSSAEELFEKTRLQRGFSGARVVTFGDSNIGATGRMDSTLSNQ